MTLGRGIMAVVFFNIIPGLTEGQRNYSKLCPEPYRHTVRIVQPGLITTSQNESSKLAKHGVFPLPQLVTQRNMCVWLGLRQGLNIQGQYWAPQRPRFVSA